MKHRGKIVNKDVKDMRIGEGRPARFQKSLQFLKAGEMEDGLVSELYSKLPLVDTALMDEFVELGFIKLINNIYSMQPITISEAIETISQLK